MPGAFRSSFGGLMRILTCAAMAATGMAPALATAGTAAVKLTVKAETVDITIGGEEFATYHFAKTLPKPFLLPVKAPGGVTVTRSLDKPEDHPHHKGIWCSIDEVNDIKFWAEKGKIENVSVKAEVAEGNPAKLAVVNHWLGTDGKPVLIETTTISIHANRLLSYDMKFTADEMPVKFGDTKEGMFGIRLVNSLREKETGKVQNAEGLKGTKECWGKHSAWVDYYGEVDGKTVGVTVMDDPKNFRKSRYHVRDYGLFTISPFGDKSYTNGKEPEFPFELKPGAKFSLRYGIYLHTGDTEQGKVANAYQQFLKG